MHTRSMAPALSQVGWVADADAAGGVLLPACTCPAAACLCSLWRPSACQPAGSGWAGMLAPHSAAVATSFSPPSAIVILPAHETPHPPALLLRPPRTHTNLQTINTLNSSFNPITPIHSPARSAQVPSLHGPAGAAAVSLLMSGGHAGAQQGGADVHRAARPGGSAAAGHSVHGGRAALDAAAAGWAAETWAAAAATAKGGVSIFAPWLLIFPLVPCLHNRSAHSRPHMPAFQVPLLAACEAAKTCYPQRCAQRQGLAQPCCKALLGTKKRSPYRSDGRTSSHTCCQCSPLRLQLTQLCQPLCHSSTEPFLCARWHRCRCFLPVCRRAAAAVAALAGSGPKQRRHASKICRRCAAARTRRLLLQHRRRRRLQLVHASQQPFCSCRVGHSRGAPHSSCSRRRARSGPA